MTDVLTNGHRTRGRSVPPLPAFTFPHSGVTVGVRRFSADTQDTIRRELMRVYPPPDPPIEDNGPELEPAPNFADPDYKDAIAAYLRDIAVKLTTKMFELALRRIVVEVDTQALEQLKEDMRAIGTPLDETLDDRELYIRHICVSSTADLTALLAYLQGQSMPTPEVVQEFIDTFQRNVP